PTPAHSLRFHHLPRPPRAPVKMTGSGKSRSPGRQLFHSRSPTVHGRLLTTMPPTPVVTRAAGGATELVQAGCGQAAMGHGCGGVPREDCSPDVGKPSVLSAAAGRARWAVAQRTNRRVSGYRTGA